MLIACSISTMFTHRVGSIHVYFIWILGKLFITFNKRHPWKQWNGMQLNKQRDWAMAIFNETQIIAAGKFHTAKFLWKHLMENKTLRCILKYKVKPNQTKIYCISPYNEVFLFWFLTTSWPKYSFFIYWEISYWKPVIIFLILFSSITYSLSFWN